MRKNLFLLSFVLLCFIQPVPVFAQTPVCPTLPTDTGMDTLSLSVTTSGTYTIWSRIKAPDTTNNSYWLQIDSQCGMKVGDAAIPTNTWTWVNYKDGNTSSLIQLSLTSGTHVVKLIGAEPGVGVDRLLFLTDASCVPTGTGDSCLQTATSTPPLTSPGTSITLSPTLQTSPTATATPTKTPTLTPTRTPTPIPTATNTPSPSPTTVTLKGDYNNSGTVDILDFNLWRDEFTGVKTTKLSDGNGDGVVDLLDFSIWLNAFRAI